MEKVIGIDGIIYSLQNYGGITIYFNELIKALEIENLSATIMLEEKVKQSPQNINKMVKKIRTGRVLERYRSCRIEDKIAVFHSSYYRLNDSKIPTIVTVHDFINEKYNYGLKKIGHSIQKINAIKAAKTIICISEVTKRDLLNYVDVKKEQEIHVIHNGVSDDYKPLEKINKNDDKIILFVGERDGYKNFKLALKALEYLPEYKLYCVGGRTINNEELRTVPDKTRSRIQFLGKISNEKLNILLNNAICLLYPTKYEGFGIPAVEAMKAGCPVIAIEECEVIAEIAGKAIERVAEDPRIIAETIKNLNNKNYRNELINNGLIEAKKYSWKKCHEQTINLYKKYI